MSDDDPELAALKAKLDAELDKKPAPPSIDLNKLIAGFAITAVVILFGRYVVASFIWSLFGGR